MTVRTRVEQANFIYRDTTDPGTSHGSNAGYLVGVRWINTSTKKEFVCVDNTANNAVWTETTQTGGSGTVIGPNSSDDRHVVVFSGTGGVHVRNSTMVVEDSGNATINGDLIVTGDVYISGFASVSGTGDVIGPVGVTANTLVRFDGATGKEIKATGITVDDNDSLVLDMVTGITSLQYNSTGLIITDDGSSAGVGGAVPYVVLNTVPTGFVKVGIFPGTGGVTATLVAEPPDDDSLTHIKVNVSDGVFTNGLKANNEYARVFAETPAGLNRFHATSSGTEHVAGSGILRVGHDNVGGHGLKITDDASTIDETWPPIPIVTLGINDTIPSVMVVGRMGVTSQSILQVVPEGFGPDTPSVMLTSDDIGLGDTFANTVEVSPTFSKLSASITGDATKFNYTKVSDSGIEIHSKNYVSISGTSEVEVVSTSSTVQVRTDVVTGAGMFISPDLSTIDSNYPAVPAAGLLIGNDTLFLSGAGCTTYSSFIQMTPSGWGPGTPNISVGIDDENLFNTFSNGLVVSTTDTKLRASLSGDTANFNSVTVDSSSINITTTSGSIGITATTDINVTSSSDITISGSTSLNLLSDGFLNITSDSMLASNTRFHFSNANDPTHHYLIIDDDGSNHSLSAIPVTLIAAPSDGYMAIGIQDGTYSIQFAPLQNIIGVHGNTYFHDALTVSGTLTAMNTFNAGTVRTSSINQSNGTQIFDVANRSLSDGTTSQMAWTTSGVRLPNLTATTVPYLDASKYINSSSVTPTELEYLSGTTSSIQNQLNSKAASVTPVKTVTNSETISSSYLVYLADGGSNPILLTLPNAAASSGSRYVVKKIDGTVNAVTVSGVSSQTIDGSSYISIDVQYEAINIISDGSNWFIF